MNTPIKSKFIAARRTLRAASTLAAIGASMFSTEVRVVAATAGDDDAYIKSVDDEVGQVAVARLAFLDAQTKLCAALGLKTTAATKLSEAERAVEGASSAYDKVSAIKDSTKVSDEANKALKKTLDQSMELSAESNKRFGEGAEKLFEGTLLEKNQIETIQNLVTQGNALVQSADLLEKPKVMHLVKPVANLSSLVPGDVKEGVATLAAIMKFAKKQNITIPSADKITALLGSDL